MGFSARRKKEKKGEKPPHKYVEIQFFPGKPWEANMVNALLDTLQELSGSIMTSNLLSRLSGFFFVAACLVSGFALLITSLYLLSPKGFEKRLNKVLVERPVVEKTQGEKAAPEEKATEEEISGEKEE